jgi:hypothetical protein
MMRMRGVSLIEALVALAVMAFGMLGVVGMQGSLRTNADISKQRSEAVRIAQETMENRRAFWVLNSELGKVAYADIASRDAVTVAGLNATFEVTETVAAPPGSGRTVGLFVTVAWVDRTGQNQTVRLASTITGSMPELAGSLGVPPVGSPTRPPQGRNVAVPREAVDQGDGTSRFSPPGAGSITWTFNNLTGYITKVCNGVVCSAFNARLLSGFIGFSTGVTQPTEAMAENPTSVAFATQVTVLQTFPSSATVECYESTLSTYVAYYCAVPVIDAPDDKWSGRSELSIAQLATSISDPISTNFRVCRYTPVRGSHPVVNPPSFTNEQHPLNYRDVTSSLFNQNFLVIRAGNDVVAFDCPADDPTTDLVNGNTWRHQPAN